LLMDQAVVQKKPQNQVSKEKENQSSKRTGTGQTVTMIWISSQKSKYRGVQRDPHQEAATSLDVPLSAQSAIKTL
jgi:hypothetical protein